MKVKITYKYPDSDEIHEEVLKQEKSKDEKISEYLTWKAKYGSRVQILSKEVVENVD